METRVIDIASVIRKIAADNERVKFIKRTNWEKIRRRVSIDKARKVLGYNPKTEMKVEIKEVCKR